MLLMSHAGFHARASSAVRRLFAVVVAVVATAPAFIARADGPDEPVPSYYQEAGGSTRRGQVAGLPVERIDPFTGKLQWHAIDMVVPGNGGMDIKVQRSYSSPNEGLSEESPIGAGWTLHFGRILRKANVSLCQLGAGPAANPVMELSDGSRHVLFDSVDGTYAVSTDLWRMSCNTGPEGGAIVRSPDGSRYDMFTLGPQVGIDVNKKQNAWYTKRITDRNGNTLDFTYEVMPGGTSIGVKTVTGGAGTVTFTYGGGKLTSAIGPSGVWVYEVVPTGVANGNFNYLQKAVRPDGGQWIYEYNPPGSGPGLGAPGGYAMKHVTYPTGGTVAYTYAFKSFSSNPFLPVSTVISQKVTSDAKTWTYSYVPASAPLVSSYTINPDAPPNSLDHTLITGPEGRQMHFHVGYQSVQPGTVYLIGALAGKALETHVENVSYWTHLEAYSWAPLLISNTQNLRPGSPISDSATYRAIMTGKTIGRGSGIYTTDFGNFDDYGNPRLITEVGTDSRTTQVTYFTDVAKWILHVKKDETISGVGMIARQFDANANLTNETRFGVSTSYTYAGGDVASKTDANNHTITYGGHSHGVPQTESHPEGVNISRQVDSAGNITSETDGENATTGYAYDGLNRITSITHATGNGVTVDWTPTTRRVTRGAAQELTTYDAFGRQIEVVNSAGGDTITRTFRYDAAGQRSFASYPNSSLGTGTVYDIVGNLLTIRHEYNPDGGQHTSGRSYVHDGNQVTLNNERGLVYRYHYRSFGDPGDKHLLLIETPVMASNITMARNGAGQMTSATQDGKTRTYTYNSRYHLTDTNEPEVGTTTFGRDGAGNMISKQVTGGPMVGYEYDARNRLKAINYAGGTPSATHTYYRDDKPKTSSNGTALREYFFDANKNLTSERLTVTGHAPFTASYTYTSNDALDTMTYGSGKKVTYQPDGFGRPTKASPYVMSIEHHPNGQLASMRYANGIETTIGLNDRQWPGTMNIRGADTMFNTLYTYDGLGNVYGIQDTVDMTYNRFMDYDDLDRLTTANGAWGSGQYSYDNRGNISGAQLGSFNMNYHYDTQNRLYATSGTRTYSFTYDVHGNVMGNGFNTFQYNDALNMKCSDCGTASEVSHDYDAANIRVRTTKGGTVTYYMYGLNGSLLWEETGPDLTEYIYVGGKQVATRKKAGN